jgi:hypothetical protein
MFHFFFDFFIGNCYLRTYLTINYFPPDYLRANLVLYSFNRKITFC